MPFNFNGLTGDLSGMLGGLANGQIQAQKPQAVPYAQPPASQMGSLMDQAYAMAGPAPQVQQPPPPMMGVPNRPGLPGGPPMIPMPGQGQGLPMQNPMAILQMLRARGMM